MPKLPGRPLDSARRSLIRTVAARGFDGDAFAALEVALTAFDFLEGVGVTPAVMRKMHRVVRPDNDLVVLHELVEGAVAHLRRANGRAVGITTEGVVLVARFRKRFPKRTAPNAEDVTSLLRRFDHDRSRHHVGGLSTTGIAARIVASIGSWSLRLRPLPTESPDAFAARVEPAIKEALRRSRKVTARSHVP